MGHKNCATRVFEDDDTPAWACPDARNRTLDHVEDAARALVHIASLGRDRLSGRSFVIADGHLARMKEFVNFAADRLGAPHPSSAPVWLSRVFASRAVRNAEAGHCR